MATNTIGIGTPTSKVGIGTPVNTDLSKYTLKTPEQQTTENASNLQKSLGLNTPAPTPTPSPTPTISPTINSADIGKTTTPTVIDTKPLISSIQNTLNTAPTAKLNSAGLSGLLKIAGVASNSNQDLLGMPLKDAIIKLGIQDKFQSPSLVADIPQPATAPTTEPTTTTPKTEQSQAEKPKTVQQQLQDIISQNTANNSVNTENQAMLSGKASAVNTAQAAITALDEQKTTLGAQNSLEALGLNLDLLNFSKDFSKGKGLTATNAQTILNNETKATNFDLSKLSIEDGKNLANYTLARIPLVQNLTIAQGDYQSASDYSKNVAEIQNQSTQFALDVLEKQNSISQQDKQAYQQQAENEFKYAQAGYVPVSADSLEKTKADILSGKTDAKLWNDPVTGNNYLIPKTTSLSELEIYSQKKAIDALYDAGKISEADAKAAKEEIANNSKTVEQADSALSLLNDITSSKALGSATGLSSILPVMPGTERANLVTKIDSLKNLLTLQNLGYLKGAMSDKDVAFITSASTALNTKMSEKAFNEELTKIKEVMTRSKLKAGGYQDLESYYLEAGSEKQSEIDGIQQRTGISDEDLLKELQNKAKGFNSVGSDTNNALNISSVTLGSNLAKANNNPGNLRFVGQAGATQGQGGFARFESPEAGAIALANQIQLDASRGLTVSQFINKYAPPSENNTGQYINQFVASLGTSPNAKLSSLDLNKITKFMAKKESSSLIA